MVLMHVSPTCYANRGAMLVLLRRHAPHVNPDRLEDLSKNGGRIVMPSAEAARQLTHKLIWEARYNAGILCEKIGEL